MVRLLVVAFFATLVSSFSAHAVDNADIEKLLALMTSEPAGGAYLTLRRHSDAHFTIGKVTYSIYYERHREDILPNKEWATYRQPVLRIIVNRNPASCDDFDHMVDERADGIVDTGFRGTCSDSRRRIHAEEYASPLGCLGPKRCGVVNKNNGPLWQGRFDESVKASIEELEKRKKK